MPAARQTRQTRRRRGPMSAKEAFIRQGAAARGLRLTDLYARTRVSRSVFYRVVRGTATSAPVDRAICRALGVPPGALADDPRCGGPAVPYSPLTKAQERKQCSNKEVRA